MKAEKLNLSVVVWALLGMGVAGVIAGIAVNPLFLLPVFPIVGLALKIIDKQEAAKRISTVDLEASHV